MIPVEAAGTRRRKRRFSIYTGNIPGSISKVKGNVGAYYIDDLSDLSNFDFESLR